MNPIIEGDLSLTPSLKWRVTPLDNIEDSLKTADLLLEDAGQILFLEIKDYDGPRKKGASDNPGPEIGNQQLLKKMLLPKLYGSYALIYGFQERQPGRTAYIVLIGYEKLDAALRAKLQTDLERIVDRVGPNLGPDRNPPTVRVHNLASFAIAYPSIEVLRLSIGD